MYRFKSHLLTLTLLLTGAFLLSGCGNDEEEQPPQPEAVSLSAEHSAVLAFAPSDSTFLMGNLEPLPEDLARHYIEVTAPAVEQAFASMKHGMDLARNDADGSDPEPEAEEILSVMQAIVQELEGKYSPEGLQSLGFSLTPRMAFYEQDLAPVMRIEIADRAALEAALNRIADNAGVDIGGQQSGNATFWQIPLGDETKRKVVIAQDEIAEGETIEDVIQNIDEHDSRPADPLMDLVIAITDQQLIASLQPQSMTSQRMDQLLASEGEFGNAAAERINAVNDRLGLLPYGTTVIDFNGLISKALESSSPGAVAVRDAFGMDPSSMDAACVADFRRMFSDLGQISSGATRLDREHLDQSTLVELNGGLAQDLQSFTTPLPALNNAENAAVAMRMGFNLIAVRDWLKGALDDHAENPFTCEDLQDTNQQLADARVALNRPLPPFISNWRGMQLTLDSIPDQDMAASGTASMMENISGLFALHMENPQMLLGMAQMFVPQLAEIELKPNGEVTALPQQFSGGDMSMELPPSWAAMTDQLLAVAFGAERRDDLPDVVQSEPVNDGTVLEAAYDYALYAESMGNFSESMMALEGEDNEEAREMARMQDDMFSSYAEVVDRVGFSMRFTDRGVEFDQRTRLTD